MIHQLFTVLVGNNLVHLNVMKQDSFSYLFSILDRYNYPISSLFVTLYNVILNTEIATQNVNRLWVFSLCCMCYKKRCYYNT